jgi:hypothetical protein
MVLRASRTRDVGRDLSDLAILDRDVHDRVDVVLVVDDVAILKDEIVGKVRCLSEGMDGGDGER